jgi:protein SCO1/2
MHDPVILAAVRGGFDISVRHENLIITFILLSSIGLLCTAILKNSYAQDEHDYYGIENGNELINFSLTDHNGSVVNPSRLKGKVTLVAFGYTNCPDICPMTLSILKHVMNELRDEQEKVQVFFITVDPENDTQERLKEYVTFFHPNFLGLTGSRGEIEEIANSFESHYPDEAPDQENDYLKSHTFSIFLLNKEGRLFLTYPPNKLNPREIANDIKKIAN